MIHITCFVFGLSVIDVRPGCGQEEGQYPNNRDSTSFCFVSETLRCLCGCSWRVFVRSWLNLASVFTEAERHALEFHARTQIKRAGELKAKTLVEVAGDRFNGGVPAVLPERWSGKVDFPPITFIYFFFFLYYF